MPRNTLRIAFVSMLLVLAFAPAAHAYAPFQMGIHDPGAGEGAVLPAERIQDAGASISRTAIIWSSIAPGGSTKPAGFDARNAGDPAYNWATTDAFVNAAVGHGVDPLLTVYSTPAWAEGDDDA